MVVFHSEPNLMESLKSNMGKSRRTKKWHVYIGDLLWAKLKSKEIISPLDFWTKNRYAVIISAEKWVLAFAIIDANMSVVTGISNPDILPFSLDEINLNVSLIDGDATYLFDFDFEKQLYSFVTCAGLIDESNALGVVFTPFNLKVWILVLFSTLLLVANLLFSFGKWNFIWIVEKSISLILGALGFEVSIRRESFKNKYLLCCLVLWSFIGIMIGNLYQAQLTESLILPLKYNQNLTLFELIDKDFKILSIPSTKAGEASFLQNFNSPIMKYHFVCRQVEFCKQLFEDQFFLSRPSTVCVLNPYSCPDDFPNILKLPELIMFPRSHTVLVNQLLSCEANTVFIHNRRDMYKVVKPKLPKVSRKYRRELKYFDIMDNALQNKVYVSVQNVENLLTPILKKYVQHGLYKSWADLASKMIFRWNTEGTSEHIDDLENTIGLTGKFLGVLYAGLSVYGFLIILLVCERIFYYIKTTSLTESGIFRLLLQIKKRVFLRRF